MAPISTSASSSSSSSSSTLQSRFICCKNLHHSKPSLLLCRLPGFPSSIRVRFALRAANPRAPLVGSVRASIEVPEGFRPGRSIETDKLPSDVRNGAMKAVDYYGGRVTIGDVPSKFGLELNEVERVLQALAADSGEFLEIALIGVRRRRVLYVFPKDYLSNLATKSFKMKLEPVLDKVKGAASYLIRVSFGTALIASIVLVYTTIIVVLSSRSESEDNRGRCRSGSGFNILINPSDLFWYWDTKHYTRRQRSSNNGLNFVESVFSFVFGDEDPNQGFEE